MRKGGDRPVNMCWRWRAYGGGRSSRRCSSRSRRGVGVDIGVGAALGAKTSMIPGEGFEIDIWGERISIIATGAGVIKGFVVDAVV
jgi:hypothetical protein